MNQEIPQIEIGQDVMDEIQKNAQNRLAKYLGELVVDWGVIKFYRTEIRIYLMDMDNEKPKQTEKVNPNEIPERIEHNKTRHKLAAVFNWVAAKQLARAIKGFSITPFNM